MFADDVEYGDPTANQVGWTINHTAAGLKDTPAGGNESFSDGHAEWITYPKPLQFGPGGNSDVMHVNGTPGTTRGGSEEGFTQRREGAKKGEAATDAGRAKPVRALRGIVGLAL